MEGLILNILPRVESLGIWVYWIIFLVGLLEALPFVGIVVPGSIILAGVGFFAGEGTFHVVDLIWAASMGAVLGDSVGYYLGKHKGKKMLSGKYADVSTKYIAATDAYMKNHGGKSVFVGRFVGILRPFIAFVAGMHHMDYRKFLFFNVTSGILWSAAYILIGFYFGDQAKSIFQLLGRLSYAIFGAVIVSALLWKGIRRVRNSHS